MAVSLLNFVFLLELVHLSCQSQIQYVKFYADKECRNLTREIYVTTQKLHNATDFGTALSVKVNGLWSIGQRSGAYGTTGLMESKDVCTQRYDDLLYSDVQIYGDLFQNASSISFYTDKYFRGVRFTSDPINSELILLKPIMMLSWYFSGNNKWSVYPNNNFTGTVTCLAADQNATLDGYGMTTNWTSRLLVGSVRHGCIDSTSLAISVSPINLLIIVISFFAFF